MKLHKDSVTEGRKEDAGPHPECRKACDDCGGVAAGRATKRFG